MAKKDKKDVVNAKYLCDDCMFFDGVCTHSSNQHVYINRKIEKLTYKDTSKKVKCSNYVQSNIKL